MKPRILILHAPGTNRDQEAARACELAGGAPEVVHINQLRYRKAGASRRPLKAPASGRTPTFQDYQMLLLPGGFSYGDALGAGARLALDLRVYFQDELLAFIESGKPVLSICNGFQTLVKAGVLEPCGASGLRTAGTGTGSLSSVAPHPESASSAHTMAKPAQRAITLTENASGKFECRWVHLAANRNARASFLSQLPDVIFCPVAHGEGNFQVRDNATLETLERNNLIAFRYVDADGGSLLAAAGRYPANPNGSVADIAGICNEKGNVLGLMPHPEDHILPIQNPLGQHGQLGLALFQAIVHTAMASG